MKKRTLVCFLIFTLCVFYSSIPNTVLGQEASLAQQVFDKHSETLQREDIQAVLPQVLEGLKAPNIQALLNPQTITLVVANPDLLAQFAPDMDPAFIALLKEDPELQGLLSDPQVQELLQDPAAIDELAGLLNVGAEPPVEEPPVVVEPPVEEPPVEEPPVVVEPPVEEPPVEEPPDTTEPPIVEPPPTEPTEPLPPVEVPMADPFDPIMPTNDYLLGQSRLGGLSLNAVPGRGFIEEIARRLQLPIGAEALVDAIVDMIPQGFFSKKQVRQILLAKRLAIFENEAQHLDYENFGNAITPDFSDFAYLERSTKHITRDSLQVYMRVPAKVGGVTFNLTGGRTVEGTEVTPDEFQTDTIPYTFRLDEELAAGHLPAWPSLSTQQLFSSVTLRYSTKGPRDAKNEYTAIAMEPVNGANGVVWEKELGVPTGSTYYYFEVVLAEPLDFETLDRSDLIKMFEDMAMGTTVTLANILSATTKLRINGWAMPDPRNLQIVDRGIIDALFTDDLRNVVFGILQSPGAANLIQKAITGQPINVNAFLSLATPKQQDRIRKILGRNTNRVLTKFETAFDPMLASVFTVRPPTEGSSLWVANIDDLADGHYYLGAVAHDADGNPLDQIQEQFTVDTHAPEADIQIRHNDKVTSYVNEEGIYVAAAHETGATLEIVGMPKRADIGAGQGYLFYQEVALDAHGNPQSTWMPLTVESTMLTSRIWSAVVESQGEQIVPLLKQIDPQIVGGLDDASIQALLATMTPQSILALLSPDMILQAANPFLKSLDPLIGRVQLSEDQAQLVIDALGATVDIVDHLVPVTFEPSEHVVMPLTPLMVGSDYGIRAMGIDTLFNVGAYAEPTRVRIVMPDHDKAAIRLATIGDQNDDGDIDDPYETGIIFADTTSLKLTGAITKSSGHPIESLMVQYQDASGVWQNIGEASLMGSEFEIDWNVADFDVSGGGTVSVRAVATNALKISDPEPMPFSITLDPENFPVDPEIVGLTANFSSITGRNPDSGAPQGTVTLSADTIAQRTSPEITSIRFSAAGQNWEATTSTDNKWSVTVNTASLPDTITRSNPGARNAALDNNQYTVKAVAIGADGTEWPSDLTASFSVDNVDDVAPLGPTNVSVTGVEATDSVFETAEDGSYTVGGLIDEYDETVNSPKATFTVQPTAQAATYASVNLIQADAEGNETTTKGGSGQLTFTVDVGELENGTYMFHALAVDAVGNVQTDTSPKITVHVENHERPAPEVLALTVDPATETNPDSGAPQGTLTVNAYSPGGTTSPAIAAVMFEIKRKDAEDTEWVQIGEANTSIASSQEEVGQDVDFLTDLAHRVSETLISESGEETAAVHPYETYQKWSIEVDTTQLDDTIDAASSAARDASLDTNPYIVRATALTPKDEANPEVASPEGVTAAFSVDNDDDVAPLGPTAIILVEDLEGVIFPDEDGTYTVGAIVDPTVESPVAIFTTAPTADPKTYSSVKLVRTDGNGTEAEAGIGDTGANNIFKVTSDIGVENGMYTFHALAVDAAGNVQTDDSPKSGVNILNFRVSDVSDLTVTAVDGVEVAESPEQPIPLKSSVAVNFTVANGSLDFGHITGATVDGAEVPNEAAQVEENTFSLMVDVSALPDGHYTPYGVVTQQNGSVSFPLSASESDPLINLDNTGPTISITAPLAGHTVDSLPTVHAEYEDGAGSGVDADGTGLLPWATATFPAGPTVGLTRILPERGDMEATVDQAAVETNDTTLVYTRSEQLPGGAYRIVVQAADKLGNTGEAAVELAISGTLPAVVIQSPTPGQMFEHGQPLISGEFSGAGVLEITTFTVDDVDVLGTAEVDGGAFSYMPEGALGDGSHTAVVEVVDSDGRTAQTSVNFIVEIPRDTTPPVISAVAPSGVVKGDSWVTLSAVVTDDQSSVVSAKFGINDKPFRSIPLAQIAQGRIETAESFTAGTHTITVVAISEGGTTQHSWTFTLEVDNVAPTITSISPTGTIRGGLPTISASANDESGVDEINIVVLDSDGEEVEGDTDDDGEDDVEGITRVDFMPEAPLDEGTYTIQVRATDTIGNSATAQGSFSIDFDTAAPIITMSAPQNEARLTERRPQISITFADAESGVDVDSIRFVLDDQLINLKPEQKSASQVIYTPDLDLAFGQHSVKLEVSDMAHKEGNVSEDSSGAREANMAVHEFTFFVESEAGPVLASRPINAPNPFKDNTRISFTLTRQSTVSIVIYDMTLRPVRVLVDNEVWDAGEYVGKGAIGWDGTSSSGEDLARGVYFCQIMVADGFEPEYAILKLALTR